MQRQADEPTTHIDRPDPDVKSSPAAIEHQVPELHAARSQDDGANGRAHAQSVPEGGHGTAAYEVGQPPPPGQGQKGEEDQPDPLPPSASGVCPQIPGAPPRPPGGRSSMTLGRGNTTGARASDASSVPRSMTCPAAATGRRTPSVCAPRPRPEETQTPKAPSPLPRLAAQVASVDRRQAAPLLAHFASGQALGTARRRKLARSTTSPVGKPTGRKPRGVDRPTAEAGASSTEKENPAAIARDGV